MRYRINTYPYGFMIERYHEPGSKAEKTKPGWYPYKYPGNLEQACTLLLELLTRDKAEEAAVTDAEALQRTVKDSVEEVREIAREYAQRKNDSG